MQTLWNRLPASAKRYWKKEGNFWTQSSCLLPFQDSNGGQRNNSYITRRTTPAHIGLAFFVLLFFTTSNMQVPSLSLKPSTLPSAVPTSLQLFSSEFHLSSHINNHDTPVCFHHINSIFSLIITTQHASVCCSHITSVFFLSIEPTIHPSTIFISLWLSPNDFSLFLLVVRSTFSPFIITHHIPFCKFPSAPVLLQQNQH